MATYPFLQVDAFTSDPLGGNPCAVILDADELSAQTMQAIAQEQNLSETAFVLRSDRANFRARYFTPSEEIPLAGHPTIATMIALVDQGQVRLGTEPKTLTLELTAGVISVTVHREGSRMTVTMHQLPPRFGGTFGADEVMPAFGLATDDALAGVPIQTVSTGTPQLMAPVRDLTALRRAQLQFAEYAALRAGGDFFTPHLFCMTGATPAGATFARHFGLPPDTLEDPFTGSATGGMAAYCWHYGLLEAPQFVAEQGHWMGRPGQAMVSVAGTRDHITDVAVTGQGVVLIRGTLSLAD